MDRSLSQSQRLLHLRGRPKILMTPNYETAQKFLKKYKNNMIGVISDVRFPKNGSKDPEAGLKFAKWIRKIDPSLPIMLQSADEENKKMAEKVNATFLHKESKTLLTDLRKFITDQGKIIPGHVTGVCAKHQRHLGKAIKRSRNIALLPYSVDPRHY